MMTKHVAGYGLERHSVLGIVLIVGLIGCAGNSPHSAEDRQQASADEHISRKAKEAVWEHLLHVNRVAKGTVFLGKSSADYYGFVDSPPEAIPPRSLPDDVVGLSEATLARILPLVPQKAGEASLAKNLMKHPGLSVSEVRTEFGEPRLILWVGKCHVISPDTVIVTCGRYRHMLGARCEVLELRRFDGRWHVWERLTGWLS